MAAISLILLPPILNTIKLPTLSALGNISLNSEKLAISVCLTIRYHASKDTEVFGCFLAKSNNRFRIMMSILQIVSHNEIIASAIIFLAIR